MPHVIEASDAAPGDVVTAGEVVYVYELPVRLWHWVTALAITVLMVTGYLIGSPPPSVSGEAYQHFLMGDIRFAHFAAGQVLAVAFLFRAFWACVGNAHSRQSFIVPVWRLRWWKEVVHVMLWYSFLTSRPHRYVGHNPLAQVAMFIVMVPLSLFMLCTGFALYSEDKGMGSWQAKAFGWVFSIWPNSQAVHTWHHLGLWAMMVFILVHTYLVIREDIVSRQSIISAMISGHRTFRE